MGEKGRLTAIGDWKLILLVGEVLKDSVIVLFKGKKEGRVNEDNDSVRGCPN